MSPSNWIDHMAPSIGPPPTSVGKFFHWGLTGSLKILSFSAFTSILTGVVEVSAVLMLGLCIDAAIASSLENPLSEEIWLFAAGLLFFLVLRPLIFGAFSYMQTVVVTPNVFNLVPAGLTLFTSILGTLPV